MSKYLRSLVLTILFLAIAASPARAAITLSGETSSPIIVTAGADDDEATITTRTVKVRFLVWSGYNSVTDECTVKDTAGNVVFVFPASPVAGVALRSPILSKQFIGLKIDTNGMDSGVLYTYLDD